MEDNNFGTAEDLEDGELWLPSDFFSKEEASAVQTFSAKNFINYSNTKPAYCIHHFDFTNRSPSSLNTFLHLQTNLQFKPAVRYSSTGVHDFCCCSRTGFSSIENRPVYEYQRLNPVDSFIGERGWSLQQNRFAMNRVRPGYGGTGVFLPRGTPTGINPDRRFVRMGQGMINRREINLPPRKMLLNRRSNGWNC